MSKKSKAKAAKPAAVEFNLTEGLAIALLSLLSQMEEAGAETLQDAIDLVADQVPDSILDEDEDEDEDEDDFDDED